MEIIDKQGRLFGTVNVVDALVVLLVLAVGVAGIALLFGGDGGGGPTGPTETRYVTLDAGVQPEYVVGAVESGDNVTLDGAYEGANVTDTYFTSAGNGTSAVLRVEITHAANTTATVDGEPLRIGRRLGVENDAYILNGTIRGVSTEPDLPTADRRVVLRGTTADGIASEITAGEEIEVAGSRVATVEDVAVYDAQQPGRRTLYLDASLRTYVTSDGVRFGNTRVETDRTLSLPIAGVQFSGTIDRVGGGLERTTESVLTTSVVDADVARQIETGDTYEVAGHPIATVENVTAYDTGNPDRKRVYLGMSVETLGYTDGHQFGSQTLRRGATLPFRTDSYEFTSEIRQLGTADLARTGESVIVRNVVSAETARQIETGDTYEVAGHSIATVEDVIAYETNDPDRKRVHVGLSVETLGYGERTQFGTQPIEDGVTLPFRTDQYDFSGEVTRVGTADLQVTTEAVLVTDVVDAEDARAMQEGDTYDVAGHSIATVEDVIAYDTGNPDRKRVYVGLSVETLGYGEEPRFDTRTVQPGTTLPFRMERYDFSGEVTRVGTADLQVTSQDVLVTDVVETSTAAAVSEGDAYRVSDRTVATVENVAVYGTSNPDRKRVYVGLSVEALGYGERPQFGANNPLEEGVTLPFRTLTYELNGQIVRLDALEQRGQATTRTVTLEMENVVPSRADSVEAGQTETNAGQTIAQVNDVTVQPAVITLTSEDGNIYEREHPVNKDVTLTAALQVREDDRTTRFKGRAVQEGDSITLDLGVTTIRATIVDLDAA
ncbi:hypothetical protein HLRTI_001123 [Halorhabdus tiamatea SARL4B]|uniref:DUF4330 family protein n=1 Tax=Halorhabdus tiamatea SARL4B TaxID=1033806 RepID=S6CTJ6_9EURY|nr:DUF4330 family protein [Halorhabdus tiamatea]ERJ06864.1 hypothetical protein HLRTI_001123 [Halorhabdus tiamatea SARL4B]CCQ32997.1 hypothetical protein (DUF4330) [Halorhabdus tiamatea SARL4B]